MSALEFGEWWALYKAEPWAERRTDVAAGVIASTVANVNRHPDARPFEPLDFAPYLKPREIEVVTTAADMVGKSTKKGSAHGRRGKVTHRRG